MPEDGLRELAKGLTIPCGVSSTEHNGNLVFYRPRKPLKRESFGARIGIDYGEFVEVVAVLSCHGGREFDIKTNDIFIYDSATKLKERANICVRELRPAPLNAYYKKGKLVLCDPSVYM